MLAEVEHSISEAPTGGSPPPEAGLSLHESLRDLLVREVDLVAELAQRTLLAEVLADPAASPVRFGDAQVPS